MRLCGNIPDVADDSDPCWSQYASTLRASGASLILREHAPPVHDQIANNCCGHAFRSAAFATSSADGAPIPLPSCSALYAGARLINGQRPLVDTGSSLRAMCQWAATFGFVSERRWREVPDNVNAIPPADVLQRGQDATLVAYYRIASGPTFADGAISALHRRRFPIFAIPVDEAFSHIADGIYSEQGGAFLGYHAMLIVGFDSVIDAFLVLNSWGEDFGDQGYVWIARSFLNRYVTDCWVLDVAPKGAP
jgi:hypothetical protein